MMREIRKEMTKTVFGEVLVDLLEAWDMPAALDYVEGLVGPTSIDGEKLIRRIEGTSTKQPGDLGELADRLELSKQERLELACALAYEQRPDTPEMTDEQARTLTNRLRR